jgi:deoxyribodipyrimidine photo-lyase
MNNNQEPIIYWFRNDLRIRDNRALYAANETGQPIIPVYIFDNSLYQTDSLDFKRCESIRMNYLIDSVNAFSSQLESYNTQLLIFKGDTTQILLALYQYFNAQAIYCHAEYASEEIKIENDLERKINLKKYWGNMLFAPDETPLDPEKSPFYYTAFKNKVLSFATKINEIKTTAINWHTITYKHAPIPLYKPIRNSNHGISLDHGEDAARKYINNYFQSKPFKSYIETRELLGGNGHSSQLSSWLAVGALSPRTILVELEKCDMSDAQTRLSAEKFKDQLIWRDYYRWLFLRYKTKIFRKTGLRTITPPQYDDHEAFNNWMTGTTSEPLINALMHQLKETGWMSNRSRMLAAYYLSKMLQVNWLWGARYFESQLIDYDVCNNYGNWAYQSGTGTDSRINRSFNLAKQAAKFDANGELVKQYNGIPQQQTLFP